MINIPYHASLFERLVRTFLGNPNTFDTGKLNRLPMLSLSALQSGIFLLIIFILYPTISLQVQVHI